MSGQRLALTFPGQGAQHPGMGRAWVAGAGWSLAKRAAEITGRDVVDLLLHADETHLRRTDNSQLATFTLEMVIFQELSEVLPTAVHPLVCAGHSLGEYSALVAAGILSFDDGVRLVAARGAAMRAACAAEPGTMAVILGPAVEDVEEAAASVRAEGGRVWVANLNSPQQSVLSGAEDDLARCCGLLGKAKIVSIPVGGAFHTPLMTPAAESFRQVLGTVEFRPGHAPVVANVDARPHQGGEEWPALLERQLASPVRWTESVRTMADDLSCDTFVEVGPGRTLSGLAKRISPQVERLTVNDPERLPALAQTTTRDAA
ncbi:ACP S-malonyltransferase [Streptomyces olivochromogenes]|uniref:ACP S-malonyltransferase n=1 Tax=Streptomyces olivochromogenes TaxID=1963 RepID=UPI002285E4E3|nr:ACP S-malonyltransferase [Streptomyces olivochromogenes]MCF3131241.1 ACP S-malonyltransferase [Streptomyces olivochromogenes]